MPTRWIRRYADATPPSPRDNRQHRQCPVTLAEYRPDGGDERAHIAAREPKDRIEGGWFVAEVGLDARAAEADDERAGQRERTDVSGWAWSSKRAA